LRLRRHELEPDVAPVLVAQRLKSTADPTHHWIAERCVRDQHADAGDPARLLGECMREQGDCEKNHP
jgi:hypothetical protein